MRVYVFLGLFMALTAQAFAGISVGAKREAPTLPRSQDRYKPNSLANRYGAGSPYQSDGMMNPYSQYGSPYSNNSWTNPYANNAPQLYQGGQYRGRWSANRYHPESTSNPYGRYGSPYSPDSINNRYGAGSPYGQPTYVYPQRYYPRRRR